MWYSTLIMTRSSEDQLPRSWAALSDHMRSRVLDSFGVERNAAIAEVCGGRRARRNAGGGPGGA